jgi:hypothetical protein
MASPLLIGLFPENSNSIHFREQCANRMPEARKRRITLS